ncbi:MAG: hypothetical protein IJT18_00160, partial [Oscillospiraceae bacterium]|nr:hypothetical protein [Oscillospiraceae bacterium]
YYLLLATNIIPNANLLPDSFPTRNVSTVWLLLLAVCLVLYYAHRVPPTGKLSAMMKSLSRMGLLLILLRGVKYSAFAEVGVLARHTWYLYYVPMLLSPQLLFGVSLLVSAKDDTRIPRVWHITLALTLALIALVLTNDLHQLVFRFQPDFADWDHAYTRGFLYYAATAWQLAFYSAAVIILVVKCRIGSAKRSAWILLIPFAVGIWLIVLQFTGTMPLHIIEFPETLIGTAAIILEGCMQLGLIPTNTNYGKLFAVCSLSAQITDGKGTVAYASPSAAKLTPAQFAAASGSRLDAHTVLQKMPVPGGFGFWQVDMTEQDRLNEALAEASDALRQETELIRLRSEMKARQAKTEQRTRVYDAIDVHTRAQTQAIFELARTARLSSDAACKEAARKRIAFLGAYVKRYANLMLLSQQSDAIGAGELGLSVSELLRYVSFCGVPGDLICDADCDVPAAAALAMFEALETMLDANLSDLQGVFVNLSAQDALTFKITLEGVASADALFPAGNGDDPRAKLRAAGVAAEVQQEDGVTFVCLTPGKGGAGV